MKARRVKYVESAKSAPKLSHRWSQLIGWNELKAYIRSANADPAWDRDVFALVGPSGIGKTTAAKLLAQEYAGEWDRLFLNAARIGTVEAWRTLHLEDTLRLGKWASPEGRGWRVVVIDEAHKLTAQSKALFLEILENVPRKTLFVLTAIEGDFLEYDRGALRRRVVLFAAEGFTLKETLEILEGSANGSHATPLMLRKIARAADGNLGQAMVDLRQASRTGQMPLGVQQRLWGM